MTQIVKLYLCLFAVAQSFSLKTTSQLSGSKFKFSDHKHLYSTNLLPQVSNIKLNILSFLVASILPILTMNIPQISATTYPVYGPDSIMNQKAHGTSEFKVQDKLRYGVDVGLADKISNYNRHWAEFAGYFKDVICNKWI